MDLAPRSLRHWMHQSHLQTLYPPRQLCINPICKHWVPPRDHWDCALPRELAGQGASSEVAQGLAPSWAWCGIAGMCGSEELTRHPVAVVPALEATWDLCGFFFFFFLSLGLLIAVRRVKAETVICVQETGKCAVLLCKTFNLTCLFHVEAPKTARVG